MPALTNAPPVFSADWVKNLNARLSAAKRERVAHKRRRSAGREIWTLDCETDPFKIGRLPVPFLWGLYDGGRDTYYEFTDCDELAAFMAARPILVYAHNGGKFDYHFMREYVESDHHLMVIGTRLARFRMGEAEFRDSWNLLPTKLAALNKMKFDYALMEAEERVKPHNWKLIQLYLKSDCVNLYNAVRDFMGEFGSHLTQAGASMKHWSKTSGVKIPRQSKFRYKEIRPFYCGGRVQCFEHGYTEKPFSLVDINSAYPYAMTFNHPLSVDFELRRKLPAKESDIQHCMIRLVAISKGGLVARGEHGSLFYPEDDRIGREYRITGWEYLAGLETGTLEPVRIREVLTFKETVNFSDYILELYERRKVAKACGDHQTAEFCKLMMNSLYGKFGADPENYSEFVIPSENTAASFIGEGYENVGVWEGERMLYARSLPEYKQRHYNCATAASITGFVRAFLWRSIQKCKGVIYCDTDSIAAESIGTLALGDGLGQWKLEMECDAYAVAGPKMYAFRKAGTADEFKTACKGVRLTADEIIKVARGGSHLYVPEAPTYSALKAFPIFTNRIITATARDISKVPSELGRPWVAARQQVAADRLANAKRAA